LAPGESRTITFVAHLDDWYEAGTLLPNKVTVTTPTPEFNTGNNVDYATGYIEELQDLSIDIEVWNITHPGWNSEDPVWAVSGDVIQFTIEYYNTGNVSLT